MTILSHVTKLLAPLCLLFLSGCATAAMRIDVDVYKGPLAQTSESQLASLIGYLEETKRSLVQNMNATLMIVANAEFKESGGGDKVGCPRRHFKAVGVKEFLVSMESETLLPAPNQSNGNKPPDKTKETCEQEETGPENEESGSYLYFPYSGKHTWKTPTINSPITWCDQLDPGGQSSLSEPLRPLNVLMFSDCMILRAVFTDSRDMLREVDTLLTKHSHKVRREDWYIHNTGTRDEQTRMLLMETAMIASQFREKAFRWAKANVAGTSPNCKTRIALMNFVLSASETGNQLQSRADALLKQLGLQDGRDARELALSTHLQDTEPTDFVHLFDWMQASADGCTGDWFRRHFYPGYPIIDIQNRIKVLERLYGDLFWSRINTVHASGVGKVNMVFVKDGIGNWNLKNYENYPGELLEAYLNVGKKALESAAKMAAAISGFGSGGVAIETALKFASQAIADPPSAISGTQLLEDLAINEANLRAKIAAEAQQAKKEQDEIQADPKKLKAAREAMIERFQNILTEFDNNMHVLKKTSRSETEPTDNPVIDKMIHKTLK